jgi:outer membrane protein OmpA-like peptidoglycan-associated protein
VLSDRVSRWTLTAMQDGRLLKSFDGRDSLPQIVDWTLSDDQKSVPRAPGTLQYSMNVEDALHQSATAAGEMKVEQLTLRTKRRQIAGNAEIEKYTLLLFDFNSSEVAGENVDVLRQIKSRIQKRSVVSIAGYGDRIGDVRANRTLADERARNAARILGIPENAIDSSDGKTYLYDNSSPEGRFYSRTVEITIRTPLEGAE